MNLDGMTEMAFTRITWRERLATLPRALGHTVLRLLRRERRYYLVLDGKVMARFEVDTDHLVVLEWLRIAVERSVDYGVTLGRGKALEIADEANAGTAGPA